LEDFDAVHPRRRHLEVTTRMTITHTVLSTLAGLVAGGSVAIVTQAGMPPQDLVSIPWDKLLGVGSGGLAFGVAWYFLQREERLRVAHDRVVSQHLETASKISGTFAETVNKILAEARTDTDRREARLIALLQDKDA
jgi:hypothetical protein